MKAREEFATSCLRLILNALKNEENDLRRSLSEAEEIQVMNTLAKQRQEAAKLKIVQSYLPTQLDEAQTNAVLEEVVADLRPKVPQDAGRVMKEAMARLGAAADVKQANALVRARLS